MLIAGAITIETSQNAGRPGIGRNACGRAGVGTKPAGSGGWNVPPAKDLAAMDVTPGGAELPKPSHVAAAETAGTAATAASTSAEQHNSLDRFTMTFPPT